MGKVAFITRWGKRLAVAGVVTGGVIYCGMTVYRRILDTNGGLDKQDEELKRREQYICIQQNSFRTVTNLLGQSQEILIQHLNTDKITTDIKDNPQNKLALWETLKVTSFSRAIASACLCTMMVVVVRVQLSVLSGYLYRHGNKLGGDLQKVYLTIVHQSLQRGLASLIQVITGATERVLLSYSLKHQLTLDTIDQLLTNILNQVAESKTGSTSWLVQYMIPQDTPLPSNNEGISKLLSATQDALEIGDTETILKELVTRALSHFHYNLTESFHSAAQSSHSLPLARVIPIVSDHSLLLLQPTYHHTMLQEMVNHVDLMTYCRNIYEAFSQD